MWMHALLTGLWGGLMALERRAFLQAMLSRPLVSGTLVGAFSSDLEAGLYVGLVFELLHLGAVSLGGAQADHDTLPAIAGAAFAAELGERAGAGSTPTMWAVAVLLFLPAGALGRRLEARLDRRAEKYFGRAVSHATSGDLPRAARQNLRAMWPQFVYYGLLSAAAVVLGWAAAPLVASLPLELARGLAWAYPALGMGAAAIAIRGSNSPRRFWAALAGAGVVLLGGAGGALT